MTQSDAERWVDRHDVRATSWDVPNGSSGFNVSGYAWPPGKEKVRIHAIGKTFVEAVERAKAQHDHALGIEPVEPAEAEAAG